jgi:hypothetical protein
MELASAQKVASEKLESDVVAAVCDAEFGRLQRGTAGTDRRHKVFTEAPKSLISRGNHF